MGDAAYANTILNADCLSVLPELPERSANFVLTDPPYLVNYRSRDGRRVRNDDRDDWLDPAFAAIHRVLDDNSFAVTFYGWPHADKFLCAFRRAGFRVVGHLMFPKRYTSACRYLKYQHECAYLLAKGSPRYPEHAIPDVIHWSYSGNKLHPTQKPVSVLTPLVESFSAPGSLVLDPFAGSGSTLVAARDAGRRYLGIELDASYCHVARQRIANGCR